MSELVTVLIGESLTEVIVPVKSLSILTNILEDSKVVSRFFVYHNQRSCSQKDFGYGDYQKWKVSIPQ